MSNASFYKGWVKYGGMDACMVSQMKAVEEDNGCPKRMYADLGMQPDLPKEALGKKGRGPLDAARWPKRQWNDEGSALHWPVGPLG